MSRIMYDLEVCNVMYELEVCNVMYELEVCSDGTTKAQPRSFRQNRPSFRQNRPSFRQNRPSFRQNRPSFRQNRPSFRQNRPSFRQNRPTASTLSDIMQVQQMSRKYARRQRSFRIWQNFRCTRLYTNTRSSTT